MKTFPKICSKYLEYLLREKSCSHFIFDEIGNVNRRDTLIPKSDWNIHGNQVENLLFRLVDA